MFGYHPFERAIVLLIVGAIVVGILLGIAAVFRGVFRRFGIGQPAQAFLLSLFAVSLIGLGAYRVISANALDKLERDCRDHILAEPSMAGVSHLSTDRHYDFWNYGASGGGFAAPWSAPPHTVPKVILVATFYRDDSRAHHEWFECHYTKRAGSGDPLQVIFDKVQFGWEYVLDESGRAVAWRPSQPAPK